MNLKSGRSQPPPTESSLPAGRSAPLRLIHAALVADGVSVQAAPGALLLQGATVVAAGTPQLVGRPDGAIVEHLPTHAVVPALVNAHTHLDLTACGCRPFGGDFDQWLLGILEYRNGQTPQSVDASVGQGVTALIAGGVAAVGDIAGHWSPEPVLRRLTQAHIGGVVYTEVFGMGPRIRDAFKVPGSPVPHTQIETNSRAQNGAGVPGTYFVPRVGLQPHAPYSSDRAVFAAALASGLPVSTHLAESPEEVEFIQAGTGRFRRFLETLGVWDGSAHVGVRHPVDWLAEVLRGTPHSRILCAHCNYIDDAAMDVLAANAIDVVYCPRSTAYFGHTGHRYRQMLERGITVALGTDSMVCLDTPDRLSTLDELRLLMQRDNLPLATALAMATVNGARALSLPEQSFSFSQTTPSVASAGVLKVSMAGPCESLASASRALAASQSAPEWLCAAGTPIPTLT